MQNTTCSSNDVLSKPPAVILLLILIEGYVSVSTEILTIRQLTPVVGSSVIVTSLIIGFFLLALAYGYRRGGLYEFRQQEILTRNLLIGASLTGIGLNYGFIILAFAFLREYLHLSNILSLILYLCVVTVPIVYILGQTLPLTINFCKQNIPVARLGGSLLHINTIGSFFGATATTLIFLNWLGVAATIVANTCLLIIAACVIAKYKVKNAIVYGFVTLGVVVYINIPLEKRLFLKTNAYANYSILSYVTIEEDSGKVLSVNDTLSSFLSDDGKSFDYIEACKKILFHDLKMQNKEILVLGAGGFSISAMNDYGNKFTYVDIDKDIEKVAKNGFVDKINGDFVAADARQYIRQTKNKFSAIILDAFQSPRSIPHHLLTREFFAELQDKLAADGVIILNIIAAPNMKDKYSKRVDNTIRMSLANCVNMADSYTAVPTNILYICNKANNRTLEVYSDNNSSVAIDNISILDKLK